MSPVNRSSFVMLPLLAFAWGCSPKAAQLEPLLAESAPSATHDAAAAPRPPEPAANAAAPQRLPAAPIPATAAGRQFAAWLAAFNSGSREALIAYHEQHFPYAVASRDVSNIDLEHGLSQGTGGFEPRRFEESEDARLVVLLEARHQPHYARARLEVSPEPPHTVSRFRIGPIPTPLELLPPAERAARTLDADARRTALESIGQQLEAHYVDAETAPRVMATVQRKHARGGYDALSDAVDFAEVLTRDLRRLARDKHLALRFGPMPPEAPLEEPAPPWLARIGYGFGAFQRLDGNVAHLVINGFPPPFESERDAIAARMTEIAEADAAIIDLRENGGGAPPTVTLMASYFFDEEPVHLTSIYRRDTDHTQEQWTVRELSGKRFGSKKPVYVLIGPHTFSGGEGFAYALQARGRAVIVGEETAGGAHPTQPYPIAGGFVLRVPWGRAINPITGTNWEGIGVIPDVSAPADEALEAAHRLALEQLGRR